MKKLKFFIIFIAVVFNIFICSKVSLKFINNNTNIKLKASNDSYKLRDSFYSLDDESVNRQSSKHFQIIWGKNDDIITKDLIKDNLENLENIRLLYIEELKMKETCKSITDGKGNYKTNIYLSNTGLKKIKNKDTFSDCDSNGFGYMVLDPSTISNTNPPSWTLAEAYADVVILHQGGTLDKYWRNTMSNWFKNQYLSSDKYCYKDTVLDPDTSFFSSIVLNSNLAFPEAENSNDSWPFINYLSENPDNLDGLGLNLIHSILENKKHSNVFDILNDKLDTSLQDIIGNYTKRMITMDFANKEKYLYYLDQLKADSDNENKIFTNLDLSKGTWVTIPDNKAPKQGGYNVIPIKNYNKNSPITIDFNGINNDADNWRATIVALNEDNSTTYSSTWNNGENSLTLTGKETAIYLIVAATPKDFKDLSKIEQDDEIPSYPYKIKLKVSSQNSTNTSTTSSNNTTENSNAINNTTINNNTNVNTNNDATKNNTTNNDRGNSNTSTPTKVCNDKIKIEMYNKIKNSYCNNLTLNFRITNTGSTSINVKDIKLHYYYTKDGNEPQSFYCDWCSINNNAVKSNFISISGKYNADTCLELSFNSNTILKPNEEIYIHSRIAKNNWTNYNQSNDYSFNSYANNYVQWNKVSGYVNGTLVWGNEP
ncbi:hypothetical protein KQI30_04405 [Clostridium bornimense]|uniref:DUF6055 domain-containing protein n=1 Tax=Clostridium bornimense TaxID=1216932 RepID=UPI001C106BA1|nr:DUF6055 domain-containing protein [Clostridium bornimense]MBU5315517.1 hypothetical protein [Clostridium bornimense]